MKGNSPFLTVITNYKIIEYGERKVNKKYNSKNEIIEEEIFNSNNDLIEHKFYKTKDVIEYTYNMEYEYDSQNNWISMLKYKNSIPIEKSEREITYK